MIPRRTAPECRPSGWPFSGSQESVHWPKSDWQSPCFGTRESEVQILSPRPLFSISYNQFLVRRLQRRSPDWTLTKSTTFLLRAPCRLQDFIEDKQFRQLGIRSSTGFASEARPTRPFVM